MYLYCIVRVAQAVRLGDRGHGFLNFRFGPRDELLVFSRRAAVMVVFRACDALLCYSPQPQRRGPAPASIRSLVGVRDGARSAMAEARAPMAGHEYKLVNAGYHVFAEMRAALDAAAAGVCGARSCALRWLTGTVTSRR